MKRALSHCKIVLFVTFLFVAGLVLFYARFALNGTRWATYPTNRHVYEKGELQKAGAITDANGTVLVSTVNGRRTYHSNENIRKATVHAVGDKTGNISTAVQATHLKQLCGYDTLNGTYSVNPAGNNIALTINSEVCVTALRQLGSNHGTVGIYNYKTGEIVCMVSTPTFDPENPATTAEEGQYVNKLMSGIYTPGSIFKLVTTLSALENLKDAETMQFTCKHGVTLHNEWLSCMGYHKTVNIGEALVGSCNAFFAQTALKLGREKLTATAEKIGFNKPMKVDGVRCAVSRYEVMKSNDIDFGWSGIGQYNDVVNPMQYLSFVGAIANGGVRVSPYLIQNIKTASGRTMRQTHATKTTLMSKKNSQKIAQMMRQNVTDNYGSGRFGGLTVCGKTGTAEVGDKEKPHSLFTGFCADEQYPYAFIVVVEKAGAGSGAAVRVAANVLKSLQNK